MPHLFRDLDEAMRRALDLARRGLGFVEPNPPVGAVVIDAEQRLLGEGWHERFGGPHAEIHALHRAGEAARESTLVVTLQPCCHIGQTPPCTRAIIEAGVRRVVIGARDPADHGAGDGLDELRAAGIDIHSGVCEPECRRLIAPFSKLVRYGVPWVHGKWAMTLDGRIASRTGDSQWISNEASRRRAHQLRGRVDAVVVGSGTALADDPLLTARPPGPRKAVRVVLDSSARLPLSSQLAKTAGEWPLLVVALPTAPMERVQALTSAGAEVLLIEPNPARTSAVPDLEVLLAELGRRRWTHILVEGGGRLLGSFFDRHLLDEVHVFVAPLLVGGATAHPPLSGEGAACIADACRLCEPEFEFFDDNVYVHGPLRGASPAS